MLIIFICVLCTLLMWKSGISAPFFSERVFITSIIIQYISVYIIFSNKNQPYSFKKITHIFVLFFLGIAPLLQYFNGVSFYGARKLFEYEYFYINLLILLILLIYNVTYPFFYKRKVSIRKVKEFKIIQVSKITLGLKWKILSLCLLSFVLVLTVNNYSFASMLVRGGALKETTTQSSTFVMLVNNFFKPLTVSCFLFTLLKLKKVDLFLCSVGLFLIVTCFPLSMPRFSAAAMYIPILILSFPLLQKRNNFSLIFIGGLLLIFPFLEKFRYFSTESDLFDLDFNMFLEGHFDSYQSLALVVCEDIVTNCQQIIGVLLFFIPRQIWPLKPIGSGAYMANLLGFGWDNISCNYFGEGYINAGFFGVIIFTVLLSYLSARGDKIYWETFIHSSSSYLKIGYLILLGLLFFMLRGDLLSSFAFTLSYILSIFTVYKVLGK